MKILYRPCNATAEEALAKLDVFFMAGRITDEEYTDLCLLVEEVYNPLPAEEAKEQPIE